MPAALVNHRSKLGVESCLVDNNLFGAEGRDVLLATLEGPAATVDRLTHTDILNDGTTRHFHGFRAQRQHTC